MEEKNVTNDIVCQSMFIIMGTSEKVNIVWRWFANALVKNSYWQMVELWMVVETWAINQFSRITSVYPLRSLSMHNA
jgi:hypothetical protein